MTTRVAIDDDPSGGNLAATLAARVTATLALCLVVLETWLGAFATTEITVFYWSLTAFVGVLALWPTGSERRRALLVCSSWLMAGWGGLVVVGLRESLIVLSVAVPLVAGFFGVRAALSTLAASLVVALVAAWLHVDVPLARSESLSTERFSSTRHAEAWLLQVGVFAGLSCMAVLVLSATSSLARRETARARAFAAIAKRSTSALVVTDSMRRIVWVNEAFIRLTGFEVAEALGRRPADLLQGSGTSPEHVRRMRDALERGEDFVVETVNYRRDKAPYWVRLELQSLRDERGAIWGFTGAQQDVTAERVGTSLDRMERALLTDLSSARALDEIDEMLCRHLGTVENVAYVRVDWPRRDPSFDTDEPTTNAPTSTRLTVGGRENERVVLALGSGTLEVGVRPEMPGLAALLQRLESIAVVVSLSRRRVLDADELDRLFMQSPEGLLLLDPTLRLRANVEARRADGARSSPAHSCRTRTRPGLSDTIEVSATRSLGMCLFGCSRSRSRPSSPTTTIAAVGSP
jgi:PAS domain S-box-containing protein